jgi:hypothetical protein
MNVSRAICTAAVVLALAACDSRSPTEPGGTTSLSGTWSGDVREQPGDRAGTLSVTIQQTGGAVAGSFLVRFADAAFDRAGTLSGTLQPAPSAVALSPDAADCQAGRLLGGSVMNMTWTRSGDTLMGTYDGFACFGTLAGRFELTRRP